MKNLPKSFALGDVDLAKPKTEGADCRRQSAGGSVAESDDDQQDVGSACERHDGKRVVKGSYQIRTHLTSFILFSYKKRP